MTQCSLSEVPAPETLPELQLNRLPAMTECALSGAIAKVFVVVVDGGGSGSGSTVVLLAARTRLTLTVALP